MFQQATLDWHPFCIGSHEVFSSELHALGGQVVAASAAWPTANLAMYLPLYIRAPIVAKQIWWVNGTAVSGNVDMGIYSETGSTKLYSTGTTVQSGTSVPQATTISNNGLVLPPGRYWFGLAVDNTTATIFRWTNDADIGNLQKFFGMQQQASAFVLPASTTFAAAVNAFVPLLGIALTTIPV